MTVTSRVHTSSRALELFRQSEEHLHRHIDRMFGWLFIAQYVACVAIAFWLTPYAWRGTIGILHPHVYMALVCGAVVISAPLYLIAVCAGQAVTRHTITIAQMLMSSLLIHLTGGRIESHFHVFGSLAFLAAYRDWRVLVPAAGFTTFEHFARGACYPESVFGVADPEWWRWLEHAGWVLFEVSILIPICRWSRAEMVQISEQSAELERAHERVEAEVARATNEMRSTSTTMRAIFDCSSDPIIICDETLQIVDANRTACRLVGFDAASWSSFPVNTLLADCVPLLSHTVVSETIPPYTTELYTEEGRALPVDVSAALLLIEERPRGFVLVVRDRSAVIENEKNKHELQSQLLVAARQAGKAEIANGALHNVGNVLNSVNTSIEMISEVLVKNRTERVADVAALLDKNAEQLGEFLQHSPQGKQVRPFLTKLGEQLRTDRQTCVDEIQLIKQRTSHIRAVISSQQNLAKGLTLTEMLPVDELIQEALRVHAERLEKARIAVAIPECDPDRVVFASRHHVLQILVNLIGNAIDSLKECDRDDRRITFDAQPDGADSLNVTVGDNGLGIPSDTLSRLFRQGFTTKMDGHGFGLHSCLYSAREMGGNLSAASDGLGLGARFTLTLPTRRELVTT